MSEEIKNLEPKEVVEEFLFPYTGPQAIEA